eukprot:COSAG02_NODE_3500_length_6650_cov_4.876355_1_plen_65_part_00
MQCAEDPLQSRLEPEGVSTGITVLMPRFERVRMVGDWSCFWPYSSEVASRSLEFEGISREISGV